MREDGVGEVNLWETSEQTAVGAECVFKPTSDLSAFQWCILFFNYRCRDVTRTVLDRCRAVLLYISLAVAVPERFVVDARTVRVAGGGSLAERPVDVDVTVAAGRVGAGTAAATLGQGCFGKVTSMMYHGAPVAVKELSVTTLDPDSLGVSGGHHVATYAPPSTAVDTLWRLSMQRMN